MTTKELTEKAEQLFEEKKYQEIIDLLPDELLVKQRNAQLFAWRGVAHQNLLEPNMAIDYLDKSVSIDPKNYSILYSRGYSYYSTKQFDKAIQDFSESIILNPNNHLSYFYRGNCEFETEQFDKAILDYNEAIFLNPKDFLTYYNRGNAWKSKLNFEKAIEDYNKCLLINPFYTKAYNNRGNAFKKKGILDKAIEDYNKLVEINPKYPLVYNNRGNTWQVKKEFNKAIEDYGKSLEIHPENILAYVNRGNAYKEIGELENALQDFTKYIELAQNKNDFIAKQTKANIEELELRKKNTIYDKIAKTTNKIKRLLIFDEEYISHYTSLSTAKILILKDKTTFRISEGAFLNDTSEGRPLFDYLENFHIAEKVNNQTIAEHFTEKPFIGSFVPVNKNDDLTLWRMYGKENNVEAKGCALTINREKFLEALQQDIRKQAITENLSANTDFNFYKVAYLVKSDENTRFIIPGSESLNGELNLLMNELFEIIKNVTPNEKIVVTIKLNEIAYLFKSADYLFEHEVRLIIDGVGFNKGIDDETPKVFIELVDIRPALHQITFGPKIEKAEEWAATFNYYLKQNYEDLNTKIVISHLPFK